MKTKLIVSMAAMLISAALPMLAHHSFAAEFDASKAIRVTGVLTKLEWTNPHSYFYLEVKDEKGNVATWGCEGGAPVALSRNSQA